MEHDTLVKLGTAVGQVLRPRKLLMGRDTRKSGKAIAKSLAFGLPYETNVFDCGVIPTPGLSYAAARGDFDYAVMITASHNPYTDNGVKLFDANGEKLSEDLEQRIEEVFFSLEDPEAYTLPMLKPYEGRILYEEFLKGHLGTLEQPSGKLKCVVDCANGATCEVAPVVFARAGISAEIIHHRPDGENINRECGSTHLEDLRQRVIGSGADLGIAFDGDGDRVLFLDPEGIVLTGDHALYFIANYLFDSSTEERPKSLVVGTIMSNLGLEVALRQRGIDFLRAGVGDKHVYRQMKANGAILGGEESGHTILSSFQKTGDGLLTAIFFLRAMLDAGLRPNELRSQFKVYPQITRSLRIKEKIDLDQWDGYTGLVKEFQEKHGEDSRIVVRYSGTEPKIRIMVESKSQEIVDKYIIEFENLIKSRLGE
jgi:phosphoglucosamine mutase